MIRLTIILAVTVLAICSQRVHRPHSVYHDKAAVVTRDPADQKISFHKVRGKAILLGDDIRLLDEGLKVIKDISYLKEHFVEITQVSDNYYKANPTDSYCKGFRFARIKAKDIEGYVDGRNLYELKENTHGRSVKFGNNEISFISTAYLGVGVANDSGLTGCSIHTPVVFSDSKSKYQGLVRMIKNRYYEEDYPYFELKADDEARDEILSVNRRNGRYLLRVKREYQEGKAYLVVAIYTNGTGSFIAEILQRKRVEE